MGKKKELFKFEDNGGNIIYLNREKDSFYSDDDIEIGIAPAHDCVVYIAGLSNTQAIELAKNLLEMATMDRGVRKG